MQILKGKVALITGSAKGIGARIAEEFSKNGASVVVNYLTNQTLADDLVSKIQRSGRQATAVRGDVSNPLQVRGIVARAVKEFEHIDILVNNAAAYRYQTHAEINRDSFRHQFEVNVLGALLMTQEAVKYFPSRGGRIINISSISATIPSPGVSIYSASKAALNAVTKSLALELGPRAITVNAVAPGSTDTGSNEWMTSEKKKFIAEKTALGRVGVSDDIAKVVTFLASEESNWLTGQVITADGGYSAI